MIRQPEQPISACNDEELALALQAGREDAFDELVRRHQARVYALAHRFTSNREDAQDVAQEVFVKVYHKIHSWRPRSGFAPWLTRLTVNQSIDLLRRRKRHQHAPLDDFTVPAMGGAQRNSTACAAAASEIGVRIQRAVAALSPMQRAVFVMRHYEGLQLSEIAEALGCTIGSVKVHLFRAIRKMQGRLSDLCGSDREDMR